MMIKQHEEDRNTHLKVREDLKTADHQFYTQFDRSVESY